MNAKLVTLETDRSFPITGVDLARISSEQEDKLFTGDRQRSAAADVHDTRPAGEPANPRRVMLRHRLTQEIMRPSADGMRAVCRNPDYCHVGISRQRLGQIGSRPPEKQ